LSQKAAKKRNGKYRINISIRYRRVLDGKKLNENELRCFKQKQIQLVFSYIGIPYGDELIFKFHA